MWGPSLHRPWASVLQPACLCHLFKLPFSLIVAVSPQCCVPLSVYILPWHSESLFVIHSLPFCNSARVSFFSVCPCACLSSSSSAFLSQSRSVGLILYLSLCLSACLPPFISHFLSPSVSEPLFSHLIPQSLCLSSCPCHYLPKPEPRWAPGLLWAPPFSIPRRGGELGRHRGGAAEGAGQEGGGGRSGPVGAKAQGRGIRAPPMTSSHLPVCQKPRGPLIPALTLTCCVTWVR